MFNAFELEGLNDGFRWRLIGNSRLGIDTYGSDAKCELMPGDSQTIAIKKEGCPYSGTFSRKCSHAEEAFGCKK